ncbi:MAG: hypothetical protein Q7V62_02220, partial [Actinomycetota bacterium]|nr:hypothetical protein [Actinomycetota bacterium]
MTATGTDTFDVVHNTFGNKDLLSANVAGLTYTGIGAEQVTTVRITDIASGMDTVAKGQVYTLKLANPDTATATTTPVLKFSYTATATDDARDVLQALAGQVNTNTYYSATFNTGLGNIEIKLDAANRAFHVDSTITRTSLVEVTTGTALVKEVQRLFVAEDVGSGMFKLDYDGSVTGIIEWDADKTIVAAAIEAELETALDPLTFTVAWNAGAGGFDITFEEMGVRDLITVDTEAFSRAPLLQGGIEVLTAGASGVSEVQQLAVTGITGGSFKLVVDGVTTGDIAWAAVDATLQANIQSALNTALGAGKVTVVAGTLADTFDLTFADQANHAAVSADLGKATSEKQTLTVAGVTGGSFKLTVDGLTTAAISWNATDA